MLLKMLWASINRGRSVKARKPTTAVKKRHMPIGTIVAMPPKRVPRIIKCAVSIVCLVSVVKGVS